MVLTLDRATEPARDLLHTVLGDAHREGIPTALVRPAGRDRHGMLEADVLVAATDRDRFEALLGDHGLRHRPARGRRPHRFHSGPCTASDGTLDWLKVDLVTDLAFGSHHELRADAGSACLDARDGETSARWQLDPADELTAHLHHRVIDRASIRDADLDHLASLAERAHGPGALVASTGLHRFGPGWWTGVVTAIQHGDRTALLHADQDYRDALTRQPRLAAGRRVTAAVARKLGRTVTPRQPLVALVGPDGAGKSTTARLVAERVHIPTCILYGGTYPAGTRQRSLPGGTAATVAGRLLATRAAIAWHRRRGRLVVLDRHPLQVRPGPDEHLPVRTRLRRHLLAATLPAPDLTVVLDVPLDVLAARRPEAAPEHLSKERERHLAGLGGGPTHVVVTDRPPTQVSDAVVELVWTHAVGSRS